VTFQEIIPGLLNGAKYCVPDEMWFIYISVPDGESYEALLIDYYNFKTHTVEGNPEEFTPTRSNLIRGDWKEFLW
jgi:hypothetical protein